MKNALVLILASLALSACGNSSGGVGATVTNPDVSQLAVCTAPQQTLFYNTYRSEDGYTHDPYDQMLSLKCRMPGY